MTTPEPQRPAIELDSSIRGWLTVYRNAVAQIAQCEAVKAEARRHLEEALGDNETGLVDGKPAVRWTVVESTRFQQKKFTEAHPDLAAEFSAPQVARRFTVVDE